MSHFARNQKRFDQTTMSIPKKNPARYSIIDNSTTSQNNNEEQVKKDANLAEQFKKRLRDESERLGSQKTKKQLLIDLDAAEARRQAILCEKVQRAKDAARHPHERVAF